MSKIWKAMLKAAPLRLWALLGGAPIITALTVWLINIVWRGPWPINLASQQLSILGWALLIAQGLLAVIVVALASVRVKGTGPGGVSFEVDGDDDEEKHITTVTATATVREGDGA